MALITKPYATSDGTTAVGSNVSSNFDTIYAEFNGNIDNTNIKANAGIVDTKLATISTSGKVATTAITGTLTNAAMNVGTGANNVVALNGSAQLPAVDGSALTNVKPFGAWTNKTSSYGAQQATTDGFLVVYATGNTGNSVTIYTDGNSNPTTVRMVGQVTIDTVGWYLSLSCPVRKNDYWKVVVSGATVQSVFWLPFGS